MKRIIAIIIAVALSLYIFPFIASASADDPMTHRQYEQNCLYVLNEFLNGNISFSEYQEQTNALTEQYYSDNTTIAGEVSSVCKGIGDTLGGINRKIGNTLDTYGNAGIDTANALLDSLLNKYTKQQQQSTTDLKGYGAMVKISDDYGRYFIFYCEYAEIDIENKKIYIRNYSHRANFEYGYLREWDESGTQCFDIDSTASYIPKYVGNVDPGYLDYYGDVRYSDGSKAPTNDEFVDVSVLDLDTHEDGTPVTDSEINDLIREISEALDREFPDTSTIEGLLKSINARLGKIDTDDDGELLSQINTAILSLVNSDSKNDENVSEILKTLIEIRDNLKKGGNGLTCEHEIAGTLYNVKPLDKNFLNKLFTDKTELKVQYEGKNYYLEPCGCLKLGDLYYRPDMNYDSINVIDLDFSNEDYEIDRSKYVDVDFNNYGKMWANLSTTQRKKFNSVVDLVYKMVEQSVPYSTITTTLQLYQAVIFNTSTPEDIVLTFKPFELFGTTVNGFEVTILSTNFFANENVASAMKIVKAFLTVVIGYAWLLVMRKKVTSMMG